MRTLRDDAGRFPVGALLTVAVLGAAGFGAYWLLGQFGYIGDPDAGASQAPIAQTSEGVDDRPEWLQGTPYELPPVITPEDEREPQSHRMQDWIWELADDDWDLQVVREGEGDNYTWLSDVQVLFLVSPTGELFKVSDLRTDFNMDIVHWDPALNVVWLKRGGKSDWEQVIEYDMITLDTTVDWAGSAVSTANFQDGGVANVAYVDDLPDGRELWVSYDANGAATGVFWREDGEWMSSLVSDEIRRMVLQGFSQDRGVDAWIDAESGRAVYHGVYRDPDTGSLSEEAWVVHDLNTDVFDDDVVVATPRDDCAPVDSPRSGTFQGDLIVVDCGGSEWLLDPYDGGAPQER